MKRIAILAALYCAGMAVAADDRAKLPEGFILIAHRGVVTAKSKENSLAALEESINRGYTHMEVDLRCTKDGRAVCLHDSNLQRSFGVNRQLDELTLTELHELVDPKLAPSFETLCKKCLGRINLMPDVKDCPRGLRDAFAQSIENSMTKHGLMKNAHFIGRDYIVLRYNGRTNLKWRSIFERDSNLKQPLPYFAFGNAKGFNESRIKSLKTRGLTVIPAINTFHYPRSQHLEMGREDIKRLLKLGIDGLQIDAVYDSAVFEFFREK